VRQRGTQMPRMPDRPRHGPRVAPEFWVISGALP
jgi:hypothetical protein